MAEKHLPLVDLKAQHAAIEADVRAAIERVTTNADFILGADVAAFEAEYARYCEATHCVGLDSGMSALELGMRAMGIGPGDEVITPAGSFIASSSAISSTGATPIWVDVDARTYNIVPDQIEAAITERTKAIMVVHLYGQPADMDRVMEIARRHGLPVIEDACQSHGARYKGRRTGSMGAFAAFSFYPSKNLGAYGDAGALTTNDPELAEKVRMMRNYGQRAKYEHVYLAWNRRLDSLQAAVLRVKLRHLDAWNQSRRTVASLYAELLPASPSLGLPYSSPESEHVYHLYVVEVENRDRVQSELTAQGIGTGIHYPVPIHLQEAYRDRGFRPGTFPVTESAAPRLLSLPMYPELTERDVRRVAEAVAASLSSSAPA
ncbi:MAG: DegT/DnrJ/EryC1/StrS family aminotransferase [Chloroflexi bacterium]|nr:MAG: DegT/DnrJ/EryC1/StrS family aminotransferase [Chloroflexota bacterium]